MNFQAIFVETVVVGDLTCFMISTKQSNMIGELSLEAK